MNLPKIDNQPCPEESGSPNLPVVNQQVCPTSVVVDAVLILRPGIISVCAPGFVQYETYRREQIGEVVTETKLFGGLTYSSDDDDVISINPLDGYATVKAEGSAVITVTDGTLSATAQAEVRGEDDCCSDMKVTTVVLLDNSASMGMDFNDVASTKLVAAKTVLEDYLAEVLPKDEVGLIQFSNFALTKVEPTLDVSEVVSAIPTVAQSNGNTRMDLALKAAIAMADAATGDKKVILFMTNGHQQPEFTASERAAFLAIAQEFKSAGGIIVCCGFKSDNYGFGLLQQLATPGAAINTYGNGSAPLEASTELLVSMMEWYCGRVPFYPTPPPTPTPEPTPSATPSTPSPSPSASPSPSPTPPATPTQTPPATPTPPVSPSPSPTPPPATPTPLGTATPPATPPPSTPAETPPPTPAPSGCCNDWVGPQTADCGVLDEELTTEECEAACAAVLALGIGESLTLGWKFVPANGTDCAIAQIGENIDDAVCCPGCGYSVILITPDLDDRCTWSIQYIRIS